ncbi:MULTISPECIES: hypothetical protein [Variovorax]|jgi:hypothetical protein|uniref:hypothetical protein n=1 Tax=Variovorax sp. 3P27G3 TaxID=2502214 RepID=UPI00201DEA73|nr:hypothetical protein [Variovorax sp. 3P27G3]
METISSLRRRWNAGGRIAPKPLMFSAGAVALSAVLSACTSTGPQGDTKAAAPGPAEQCAQKRLVLPLDHGPRPQTTPYENKLRKQRFAAEAEACLAAASKGGVQ